MFQGWSGRGGLTATRSDVLCVQFRCGDRNWTIPPPARSDRRPRVATTSLNPNGPRPARLPAAVLFGAAYYHEYQPYDRLKTDLDLMAEAHFSVIRVGESVWSTWEPENGRFDLDWLQPVLDGAQARGISVILGTPTYAVPPWLARLYPEIAPRRAPASGSAGGADRKLITPIRPSASTPSG